MNGLASDGRIFAWMTEKVMTGRGKSIDSVGDVRGCLCTCFPCGLWGARPWGTRDGLRYRMPVWRGWCHYTGDLWSRVVTGQ